MNEATLLALDQEIYLWKKIVDGVDCDEGTSNSPLCKLFFINKCVDCPIRETTGSRDCMRTRYDKWCKHHKEAHATDITITPLGVRSNCEDCTRIAIRHRKFLMAIRSRLRKV